ncbi:MAG: ShlB/FhaC/HecB family hemolysin secretion/activation protein [Candidatus Gastranaerophilales bacterium]|nr:ShlB/FhaC/HecB family hemolysin secretion/activation protein [Candidatus Gastranaerophilales bacterium]
MKKLTIITCCLFINCLAVNAIEAGDIGGSNAEVINRQNLMQLEDQQIEKKYIETVPQDLDAEKKLKEQQQNQKDVVKGNLTYNPQFKLNKIIFEGNTKYSDKKLLKLANGLVGQEVYLEDVMDYTIKISRFYQQNGYLTSYAYLEPQEIADGIVKINIKESKVSEKEAYGNRWEKEWYLKNIALGGRGLLQGKVFNSKDLQGAMKNINKEDYLKGSVEISKNKNEDTVIKLNVADRFPLNLSIGWDDFGRNYTGRQRFTGIIGIDNLTGFGDRIYGGAILSQGATGALAGYQIPVNKYGTKLSFDYSYSKVFLGGPYQNLDIQGKAVDYGLRLTHPLISTATKELTASVSVNAVNSKTDIVSLGQNIADYSLRVLRTGLYGMFDDKNGRTLASIGVDMGVNAFGATENIDSGPQSTFYKLIASIARIQRLPKNCLGIIRLNGQYTGQSLYASEQMYLGGAYSIRGYQPSELLGDYGMAGTLELRTPVPGLKQILPKKVKSWSDKAKLAFFYDWGWVKEYNDMYGYPSNFLQSVGFGTYINVTNAISLQMGVGIPVGPKNYNDDSGRFYFAINTDVDRIFMKPKERL